MVTPRLDKAEQRSDWSRRPLLERLGVKASKRSTWVAFLHMGRSLFRGSGVLNTRHVCGFMEEVIEVSASPGST